MTTYFVIKGLEPQARSIFAVEAMGSAQRGRFNAEHEVYVCRNDEGIYFSKEIKDAFLFADEDDACNVIAMFEGQANLVDGKWMQYEIDVDYNIVS